MEIAVGAKSDVGLRRTNNEDAFIVVPDARLFVVCDGMGGLKAGEVASRLAVEVIQKEMTVSSASRRRLRGDPRFSEETNRLGQALAAANRAIYHAAQDHSEWEGMGTTAVAALLSGNRLSIAHAGDSRLYLVRDHRISQLTPDHSYVAEQIRLGLLTEEQAKSSPHRNIITRGLGPSEDVAIELNEMEMRAADRLILCSDGLTKGVPDSAIRDVVLTQSDAQTAAEDLIKIANDVGGEDNTTVITVFVNTP